MSMFWMVDPSNHPMKYSKAIPTIFMFPIKIVKGKSHWRVSVLFQGIFLWQNQQYVIPNSVYDDGYTPGNGMSIPPQSWLASGMVPMALG